MTAQIIYLIAQSHAGLREVWLHALVDFQQLALIVLISSLY